MKSFGILVRSGSKFVACVIALSSSLVLTSAQSGGGFEITESVVAAGGTTSTAGIFEVNGTTGQPGSGVASWGQFSITSGFWNFTSLAPTAAPVSISGRVLSPTGSGLFNAILYLQTRDGEILTARSSSLGYYRFDGIEAGQSVLLWVESKRYSYPSRVVSAADDVVGLDFIPQP